MLRSSLTLIFASVTVAGTIASSGCFPLERQQECIDAEACDLAFERPFGDFGADDDAFGDTGTCWYNTDTAKTCTDECLKFIDEQRAIGEAQDDQAIVDACGGEEEEEEEEVVE